MIRIDIVNDVTGDEHVGNYDVYMILPKERARARVTSHYRADGWFILARRAIGELYHAMIEEGGDSMPTSEMQQGRSITVTYVSEKQLTENEIRELIQTNAPSEFQVQNVELQDQKSGS